MAVAAIYNYSRKTMHRFLVCWLGSNRIFTLNGFIIKYCKGQGINSGKLFRLIRCAEKFISGFSE